jgi:hypothetical protein
MNLKHEALILMKKNNYRFNFQLLKRKTKPIFANIPQCN